jgi:hypothetical protein
MRAIVQAQKGASLTQLLPWLTRKKFSLTTRLTIHQRLTDHKALPLIALAVYQVAVKAGRGKRLTQSQ